MSRYAVSCEHFASAAQLEVVSFPAKPVQQAIDHLSLTVVQLHLFDALPKPRLGEHATQSFLSAVDSPAQAAEKPFHPCRAMAPSWPLSLDRCKHQKREPYVQAMLKELGVAVREAVPNSENV